jgi:choline dehydrogenase-like flavoprotein
MQDTDAPTISTDIAIVGSGMGGGTLAYALRNRGARILIIERGGYLPREPENWSPREIFVAKRYRTTDPYLDGAASRSVPRSTTWSGLHQGLRRRPAALPARGLRGARERGGRLAGVARQL